MAVKSTDVWNKVPYAVGKGECPFANQRAHMMCRLPADHKGDHGLSRPDELCRNVKAEKEAVKPSPKVLESAKRYLYAHAIFCTTDCFDSMQEAELWLHTYEFIREEPLSIVEFVHKYLEKEIQKAKDSVIEQGFIKKWNPAIAQFLDEK